MDLIRHGPNHSMSNLHWSNLDYMHPMLMFSHTVNIVLSSFKTLGTLDLQCCVTLAYAMDWECVKKLH